MKFDDTLRFIDAFKRVSAVAVIAVLCLFGPSASLISKQAFVEVGGFDDRLAGHEDDDLFLRLFLAGYTAVNTPPSRHLLDAESGEYE